MGKSSEMHGKIMATYQNSEKSWEFHRKFLRIPVTWRLLEASHSKNPPRWIADQMVRSDLFGGDLSSSKRTVFTLCLSNIAMEDGPCCLMMAMLELG